MAYEDFKKHGTVLVDDCYLADEVNINNNASKKARVLSEPSDEEELVCIQYETGTLDYVPQNILTVLKKFRKTWRHEVIIEAEDAREANEIWENLSLGILAKEVADGVILSHEFVENVSFEDENYDEVKL